MARIVVRRTRARLLQVAIFLTAGELSHEVGELSLVAFAAARFTTGELGSVTLVAVELSTLPAPPPLLTVSGTSATIPRCARGEGGGLGAGTLRGMFGLHLELGDRERPVSYGVYLNCHRELEAHHCHPAGPAAEV